MKVFITFSALLIVMCSCLVYRGDLERYNYEQELLKMVAEECAACAALDLDAEEASMGNTVFDRKLAYESAHAHMTYALKKNSTMWKYGDVNLHMEIEFEDDFAGYSAANSADNPTVSVKITASGNDFFHLPFLEKRTISRRSKYELVTDG